MRAFDPIAYAEQLIKDNGKRISDKDKTSLRLVLAGQKYAQIAEAVGLNEGAVKAAIQKWWITLSEILGERVRRPNLEAVLKKHWELSQRGETVRSSQVDVPALPNLRVLEEVPTPGHFVGRAIERVEFQKAVSDVSLTMVTGEPGIGKTGLLGTVLGGNMGGRKILWQTIDEISGFNALYKAVLPHDERDIGDAALVVSDMIERLVDEPVIIVLDQAERLLKPKTSIADMFPYYDHTKIYGTLIKAFACRKLAARLVLVTQQPFSDVVRYERDGRSVKLVNLKGFTELDARDFFKAHDLLVDGWQELYERYNGHPGFLGKAVEVIQALYGGDIELFLTNSLLLSTDTTDKYHAEFDRLAPEDIQVLTTLAVEGLTTPELAQKLKASGIRPEHLIGSLQRLQQMAFVHQSENNSLQLNQFVRKILPSG
jgi:hypothetical protein